MPITNIESNLDEYRIVPDETDDFSTESLFFRDISRYPVLPKQEQLELIRAAQAGNTEAGAKLLNSNLRLVVSIARRYRNHGMELPDLISEGSLGMIHALKKFDPDRGNCFTTYATWWIKQSIRRGIGNKAWLIRTPINAHEKINCLGRVKQKLIQTLGREPTVEELAAETGISVKTITHLQNLERPLPLDKHMEGHANESSFGIYIPGEKSDPPDKAVCDKDLSDKLMAILKKVLTAREARIIEMRFGLNGNGGVKKSLEQTSGSFGVTRERIRQIENDAKRKLLRYMERNGLALGDFLG